MRISLLPLLLLSCKVPIYGVNAGFTLADVSWFAEEQTLFVFWEMQAEQGIGEFSQIEVSYRTDDAFVDWTPVQDLVPVHGHLDVDCGVNALCGSVSVAVPIEPRDVRVRLRYHRDGELALDADTVFNVVGRGPAHTHRSLLIYGVFDESNQRVQWRSRHVFPTIRNEQAERLGLRRVFRIDDAAYGTVPANREDNPYIYGVDCADDLLPAGLDVLESEARAVFHPDPLPLDASAASGLCAQSTVVDALGAFTTGAIARKNPEVRAAFPVLRSPIREARQLPFFLAPCGREISAEHEAMQRQRLLIGDLPPLCTEGWESPQWRDDLVVAFRDAVEAARPDGEDMVLVVGLHQDTPGLAAVVEEALNEVVPGERHRSTPRLAGAFVYDSAPHVIERPDLAATTLWCPSTNQAPDASGRSCAAAPDFPGLVIGPLTLNQLQILPTRSAYVQFIETFSVAQAGEMTELAFLAPEFATTADHVDFGPFGVVTFLNGETLPADPDDAFSFCVPEVPLPVVVRSEAMSSPPVLQALTEACLNGVVGGDLCLVPELGVLPVAGLSTWHNILGETNYEVGLFWEFPFLLRLQYEAVTAGALGALGFSVPFGIASPAEEYFGTTTWLEDEFSLDPALTQCRRFCDHPTFDPAGIYQVGALFRESYAQDCYLPRYPTPGDSGFPRDP